MASTKNGV